MRDIILLPALAPILAQTTVGGNEWERLGITGLSIAATVFIWRYFNEKQAETDRVNMAERDRLLKEANDKNQEIVDLLKQQIADSRKNNP